MEFEYISNSPSKTIELGKKIGSQLKGGEIIALTGHLGSGKTHLIKGIAEGAGAQKSDLVNSPTFVLVNEYRGKLDIYHIDAYRLDTTSDFESIGFDDYCYPQSVVLIEWADKIENAIAGTDYMTIQLCATGSEQRTIQFKNIPDYITL